ncbi:MAG: hypothetical protein AB1714_27500 [Acidobacteriota bacterium]
MKGYLALILHSVLFTLLFGTHLPVRCDTREPLEPDHADPRLAVSSGWWKSIADTAEIGAFTPAWRGGWVVAGGYFFYQDGWIGELAHVCWRLP